MTLTTNYKYTKIYINTVLIFLLPFNYYRKCSSVYKCILLIYYTHTKTLQCMCPKACTMNVWAVFVIICLE